MDARWQVQRRSEQLRNHLDCSRLPIRVPSITKSPLDLSTAEGKPDVSSTYLAESRTRSCTAHDVIETATSNDIAAITVICLNCVSPIEEPNMLTTFIEPMAYPIRLPIANILPASRCQWKPETRKRRPPTPCRSGLLQVNRQCVDNQAPTRRLDCSDC